MCLFYSRMSFRVYSEICPSRKALRPINFSELGNFWLVRKLHLYCVGKSNTACCSRSMYIKIKIAHYILFLSIFLSMFVELLVSTKFHLPIVSWLDRVTVLSQNKNVEERSWEALEFLTVLLCKSKLVLTVLLYHISRIRPQLLYHFHDLLVTNQWWHFEIFHPISRRQLHYIQNQDLLTKFFSHL